MDREQIARYLQRELRQMPEIAERMTQSDGVSFNYRSLYFRLRKRIDDFLRGKEERLIIMPGLRGVGKTTILFQLYNYLTKQRKVNQEKVLILSADELKKYFGIGILEAVRVFAEDIIKSDFSSLKEKLFIMIDEAHFDREWDLGVKIIYDRSKNVFVLVTGSSALSMEMSADVARRSVREPLFPLNFSEYNILKYKFFPEKNTAHTIRNLIFNQSEADIKLSSEIWRRINIRAIRKNIDLNRQFELFLIKGGFPFCLTKEDKIAYEGINSMLDRVVEKDILTLKSFTSETRNLITRIIYFLAMQKPGSVSDSKLSQRLGASSKLIRDILDILEKTHLLLSVKPYSGAGKMVRKPWKYYFLSPSINAAIRYKLGTLDILNRDMLGMLAECFVASSFLKIKETVRHIGIFYDAEERGVDFLIQKAPDEVIPVEVSIGKKGERQIRKAVNKYKAEYGVIISDINDIKKEDSIIYIPITFFSFV